MIFKVIMSSKPDVPIENEAALKKFFAKVEEGKSRLIITKYGAINPAFIVTIVPYAEKNNEIVEMLRMKELDGNGNPKPQYTLEQATANVLGESPFNRLLGLKNALLGDGK